MYGYDWKPYVPVGQKKANARKYAARAAKKQNRTCQPIQIEGNKIAKSFWGKAWCDHVESLSDYANRLPRGRTYVRNGSVVDLVITPGSVKAIVAGSEPYSISISINKLNQKTWDNIKRDCSQSIDSLLDLLGGRLSDGVMQRLTDKKSGCFPVARQIEMYCDCPDWSACCKHLAAVMYGIGSRLDSEPELLFLLRGVNQEELISQAVSRENLAQELHAESGDLAGEDLGAIFGIELDSNPDRETPTNRSKSGTKPTSAPLAKTSRTKGARAKKTTVKKSAAKNASTITANAKKEKAKIKPARKTAAQKKASVKKKAATKKKATAKKKVVAKKKAAAKTQVLKTTKTSKKKKAASPKTTRKNEASQKFATSKKKSARATNCTKAKKPIKAKKSAKSKQPVNAKEVAKEADTPVQSTQTKNTLPKKRSRRKAA